MDSDVVKDLRHWHNQLIKIAKIYTYWTTHSTITTIKKLARID